MRCVEVFVSLKLSSKIFIVPARSLYVGEAVHQGKECGFEQLMWQAV
jgi:hypothetical protein